jgi:hypothetical protein
MELARTGNEFEEYSMELDEQDFIAITGCTNVRLAPWPGERRKRPRVPVGIAASVYPLREGTSGYRVGRKIHARIREMSESGVGLLSAEPLCEGETFVVGLPRKRGPTLWMYCRSARCQSASNRLHVVGARFERPVRAEELMAA